METWSELTSLIPMFFLKAGVAVVCGGLIGIERERRGKPAGFRTNVLICLGATLYMLVSDYIAVRMGGANIDHTRIAAQVVTGIGFIGAGTIIQSGGTIIGLTSAAIIWVTAAIGLIIGVGYPILALICTLLVLLTLIILGRIERHLLGKCHFMDCEILIIDDLGKTKTQVVDILIDQEGNPPEFQLTQEEKIFRLKTRYCDKHPAHTRVIHKIQSIPGVIELTSYESPDQ